MTAEVITGSPGDEVLKQLYYGPGKPSSYSSANRLFQAAKKEVPDITLRKVKEWLSKQVAYTRHKKVKLRFPRRKVLSLRIDDTWACDLIQLDTLSSYNHGFQYILTVLDLFSRYLWCRKLKQKSTKEMDTAMRSIVEENGGRSPYKMWTDEGLVRNG